MGDYLVAAGSIEIEVWDATGNKRVEVEVPAPATSASRSRCPPTWPSSAS
ncbi:MAG: hypothetical protein ACYTGI_13085 [Planctomycetota bacterium]|jgi:hypothetical protein